MEEEKFSLSGTFQKGKEYIDTQLKLLKLRGLAKGSRIVGSLLLDVINVVFLLFIVFFCSLALGFFLGEVLDSNALGFLLTGVIFFVFVLLIRAFKPALERVIMNITIRKIAGKWQGEEDDDENSTGDNIKSSINEGYTENK